jgi:hypothetical protein
MIGQVARERWCSVLGMGNMVWGQGERLARVIEADIPVDIGPL